MARCCGQCEAKPNCQRSACQQPQQGPLALLLSWRSFPWRTQAVWEGRRSVSGCGLRLGTCVYKNMRLRSLAHDVCRLLKAQARQ